MSFLPSFLKRKSIDLITVHEEGRRLVPTLSWPHLIAFGIGAIVGTGIYTLIGVGAEKAGPAVLLSFVIAGVICACAAGICRDGDTDASGRQHLYVQLCGPR